MEKLVSSQVGSFYPYTLKFFLTFSINLQVFHWLTKRFEREKNWLYRVNTSGKPNVSLRPTRLRIPTDRGKPRHGFRKNIDRFPENEHRRRKVLVGCRGMLPREMSWVSESFRQDIGQFHTPRITPYKSADFFISRFQLGEVFHIKKYCSWKLWADFRKTVETGVDPRLKSDT